MRAVSTQVYVLVKTRQVQLQRSVQVPGKSRAQQAYLERPLCCLLAAEQPSAQLPGQPAVQQQLLLAPGGEPPPAPLPKVQPCVRRMLLLSGCLVCCLKRACTSLCSSDAGFRLCLWQLHEAGLPSLPPSCLPA